MSNQDGNRTPLTLETIASMRAGLEEIRKMATPGSGSFDMGRLTEVSNSFRDFLPQLLDIAEARLGRLPPCRIVQIVESMNNIHGLDDRGNVWFMLKDADDKRHWTLLLPNSRARDLEAIPYPGDDL